MNEVTKVYSNALFQLGVEENLLDTINNDLKDCVKVFELEPEFLKVLSSPIITNKEKLSMLQAVFSTNCNELVFNYICLLVEKNRINLFSEIQQDFLLQYNEAKNLLQAEVITCVPLTPQLKSKIVAKLSRQTNKNVTITETIDTSIIGGIIIKYGNTVIDSSLKIKFKDLSQKLHKQY